jgi:hypothetical protein
MTKKKFTKGQAKFSVVLAAFFAILGLAGCLFGLHWMKKQADSKNWPSASGTITFSGWRESQDQDGHIRTTSYPDIRYEYVVSERTYKNDQVGFWNIPLNRGGSGGIARDIVRKYNKGDSVEVFYNPNDPKDSVLDRELVSIWVLSIPLIGGLFFGIGGIIQSARALKIVLRASD